jgi:hypothetical protein
MDPNQLLDDLREMTVAVLGGTATRDAGLEDLEDMLYHLSEMIDDLDTWLTKGGFPPDDWMPRK